MRAGFKLRGLVVACGRMRGLQLPGQLDKGDETGDDEGDDDGDQPDDGMPGRQVQWGRPGMNPSSSRSPQGTSLRNKTSVVSTPSTLIVFAGLLQRPDQGAPAPTCHQLRAECTEEAPFTIPVLLR